MKHLSNNNYHIQIDENVNIIYMFYNKLTRMQRKIICNLQEISLQFYSTNICIIYLVALSYILNNNLNHFVTWSVTFHPEADSNYTDI